MKNIALRYSEYEGMDTLIRMRDKAAWVWVDCFTRLPLNRTDYVMLKDLGYQLCLVSPELQGQPEKLELYKKQLKHNKIILDAVCTKAYHIDKWNNHG